MTRRAQTTFEEPVDVLNYALTLEHLENAFYRDGLEEFDEDAFTEAGFDAAVRERLAEIGAHEQEHVDTLTEVIESLEGTPEEEAEYDFGYADLLGFIQVAQALENTGVSAYQGAAQFLIEEDELLTAALNIHSVEARHASYINGLVQASPFPAATDTPLSPDEVLEIAGPFIVS
jgi:hypothetical protein